MDISKIISEVILLKRGVKELYEEIAADKEKDNTEIANALRILAMDSEEHTRKLESQYEIFEKPEAISEGVKGLLSLSSERINKVKEKTNPVEILREGIEIERYMEQLYKGLADNWELEAQLGESLGQVQEGALKASKVFGEIAADEKRHQDILKRLALQIATGQSPGEIR